MTSETGVVWARPIGPTTVAAAQNKTADDSKRTAEICTLRLFQRTSATFGVGQGYQVSGVEAGEDLDVLPAAEPELDVALLYHAVLDHEPTITVDDGMDMIAAIHEDHSELLDTIAAVGPEQALERAFFRVAVSDIDEVRHRGTEMRVTYRGADGFVSKTIDLATAVDDVIGLLSRRVPVMAAGSPVPTG